MKRIISIILIALSTFSFAACSKTDISTQSMILQNSQMKTICELATMKCYYHDVVKYTKENASGIWWWKKDRHFWVEYDGEVTMGMDASKVKISVSGINVTITIPPAKVLDCKVEDLSKDSFIIANNSAKVEAEHQTEALKEAQLKLEERAKNETLLLESTQKNAQKLLSDYITNIGKQTGKSYKIEWNYLSGAKEFSNSEIISSS